MTYLPIRDLPGPEPGRRASEYSQSERVGEQIVRLIAMFAMHLMGAERERLKLFSFDEGWRLLGDPVGRALLASLQRMGRSELAVPIISTQLVSDTLMGDRESLENLIGATFVFGMRSEAEAGRALALLGLDPEDAAMRRTLLELEAGDACFATTAGESRRSRSSRRPVAAARLLDHAAASLIGTSRHRWAVLCGCAAACAVAAALAAPGDAARLFSSSRGSPRRRPPATGRPVAGCGRQPDAASRSPDEPPLPAPPPNGSQGEEAGTPEVSPELDPLRIERAGKPDVHGRDGRRAAVARKLAKLRNVRLRRRPARPPVTTE